MGPRRRVPSRHIQEARRPGLCWLVGSNHDVVNDDDGYPFEMCSPPHVLAGLFVREDVGGSALRRVDAIGIIEGLATGCVG